MMRLLKLIIILVITIIATSCQHDKRLNALDAINELINREQLHRAKNELKKIKYADNDDKEFAAKYNLVKAKLCYKLSFPQDDKKLNASIDYYKKSGNNTSLAESYLYKALILEANGRGRESIKMLKEAENIAEKIKDTYVCHDIKRSLAYSNNTNAEYELALSYGTEALNLAKQSQREDLMAIDYMLLSEIHDNMHEDYKSNLYADSCEMTANALTKKRRSYCYAAIGWRYLRSDIEKAEKYIRMARQCDNNINVMVTSGQLAQVKGDYETAEKYLKEALNKEKTQNRIYIYITLQSVYVQMRDYKKAYETGWKIDQERKQIFDKRLSDNIVEAQSQYDYEIRELKFKSNVFYSLFSIGILIAVCVIIYLRKQNKLNDAKRKIAEINALLEYYKKQVMELERSSTSRNDDIDKLKKKITTLNDKQTELLKDGKLYFDKLRNGEKVVGWSAKTFKKVIEYYRYVDFDYVLHLENDYINLSHYNIIFMILCKIGKTDEEIADILSITVGSVRSIRSRINGKKIS